MWLQPRRRVPNTCSYTFVTTVGKSCENSGRPEYTITLRSLINVQSVINVQGDKFSKKNKRTGQKSSPISVQVLQVSFFRKYVHTNNTRM